MRRRHSWSSCCGSLAPTGPSVHTEEHQCPSRSPPLREERAPAEEEPLPHADRLPDVPQPPGERPPREEPRREDPPAPPREEALREDLRVRLPEERLREDPRVPRREEALREDPLAELREERPREREDPLALRREEPLALRQDDPRAARREEPLREEPLAREEPAREERPRDAAPEEPPVPPRRDGRPALPADARATPSSSSSTRFGISSPTACSSRATSSCSPPRQSRRRWTRPSSVGA